jgi:hypothetical protein
MGDHRRPRPPRLWVFVVLVLVAVAVPTWIYISVSRHQDDEKHAAVAQANGIADPILALCAQGGDVGARLAAAGLCSAAAGVKAAPHDAQADAVTQDEVHALVAQELAKHPTPQPVGPTQAQIAAAVQAFITANPTMFKAPAPTSAQIEAAVAAYLRAHPIQQSVPIYPQYDMPGLGGFSGAPGGVWSQPWPSPRTHAAR